MQNKMKLDAEIFDADLNENRCKFARQPWGLCALDFSECGLGEIFGVF